MSVDLSTMSKDDLLEFADARGIDVDKRMSAGNLAKAIGRAMMEDGDAAMPEPEETAPLAEAQGVPEPAPVAPPARRMSNDEQVAEIVSDWVNTIARDIETINHEIAGDMLVVKFRTRHGNNEIAVKVASWSAAGVKAALAGADEAYDLGEMPPEPDESWLVGPDTEMQARKDRLVSYAASRKISVKTTWKAERIFQAIKDVESA